MKKISLFFLSLLIVACSTDANELIIDEIANEEVLNNAPAITSQQFSIAEHL